MLSKSFEIITNELESNNEYRHFEEKILESTDKKEFEKNVDNLSKLRDVIIDVAYLEGFAAGIEKKTKEDFKENITSHLKSTDLYNVLNSVKNEKCQS